MGKKISSCVKEVAPKVLGVSKGPGPRPHEFWWLNKEAQRVIKPKREC